MNSDTYEKVSSHMNRGYLLLQQAKQAVQQAILTMTDTEGVNLPLTKYVRSTLGQLLEHFPLWNSGKYAPEPMQGHEHMLFCERCKSGLTQVHNNDYRFYFACPCGAIAYSRFNPAMDKLLYDKLEEAINEHKAVCPECSQH